QAESDLEKLERMDRRTAVRIYRKLRAIAHHPRPLDLAVPLTNVAAGTHRFRIGAYRATFEIHDRTIYITRIAHRREAYKK
ncbi:MAG: type II toxin-antitoxin system RelE/ParE family toxin, partial [Actinomycetota bacterium]|nr:type II toxin-antitoxin system RelE/ParE family toxin [Actinomycetota bacterium]